MAYVQFKALLTEDAEVVWDAEWFTDREAEERFGDLEDVTDDYPDIYRVAVTQHELRRVRVRCASLRLRLRFDVLA